MEKPAKLTAKQEAFCQEYLIDSNATQAAIRAGYAENSAQEQGSRMLSKSIVFTRVSELRKERMEKLHINQEWVLQRLVTISDRCLQQEPVREWDQEERCFKETGEYTFDSNGANKATELIGRHVGLFEKDNNQKQITQKFVGYGKEE